MTSNEKRTLAVEYTDPSESESTNCVAVTSGAWNLRTGPSSSFHDAKIVHGGEKLQKIDLDGWVPVKVDDEVFFLGPRAVQM